MNTLGNEAPSNPRTLKANRGVRKQVCFVSVLMVGISVPCFAQAPAGTPEPNCLAADLSKELNVTCKELDRNLSALNPDWALHAREGKFPLGNKQDPCYQNPSLSQCTSQPTSIDEARLPALGICFVGCFDCIHGHVNWQPATFTGRIGWLNFADDWDFNFQLLREDQVGIAANNNTVRVDSAVFHIIELEFDSDETAAKFTTDWWSALYKTAQALDFDSISTQLNPTCPGAWPQGVVYGEFGLDCEHGCRSEVHPVYALALETNPRADENTWAIFARNWGNEGECSSQNHLLDSDTIRILLPRNTSGTPEILTAPGTTEFATTTDSIPFPDVNYIPGKGILLTFHLPPAAEQGTAEMLLKIKWSNDTFTPPACSNQGRPLLLTERRPPVTSTIRRAGPTNSEGSADEEFGALFRKATGKSPQRSTVSLRTNEFFLRAMPQTAGKTRKRTPPERVQIATGEPTAQPSKPARVVPVADVAKQRRDQSAIAEICAAAKKGKLKVRNQAMVCPAESR